MDMKDREYQKGCLEYLSGLLGKELKQEKDLSIHCLERRIFMKSSQNFYSISERLGVDAALLFNGSPSIFLEIPFKESKTCWTVSLKCSIENLKEFLRRYKKKYSIYD